MTRELDRVVGPGTPEPPQSPAHAPAATSALILAPSTALEPVPTTALEPATIAALAPAPPEIAEPSMTGDPFPREAWATLTGHAAGYLRLTVALLRDPAVSRHRRAALLAAAAYFASPIDLIPGIVPVLGQVDDLAVAMLAIRLALNALEPGRRQVHLEAAGLSDEAMREDLLAAGRLAAWAARSGARTGIRVGRGAIRVTVRSGRALTELAVRGGRAAARRAAPVLDQTSTVAGQAATSTGRRVADAGATAADLATGATGRAASAGRSLSGRIRRRIPAAVEPGLAAPDGGTPADGAPVDGSPRPAG